MSPRSVAIIIPFYNESYRLSDGQYLIELSSKLDVDFFYINDGSTDNTQSKLEALIRITGARLINLESNCGKGNAVRYGLLEAINRYDYDFVGYLDADGAFPLYQVTNSLNEAIIHFLNRPTVEIFIASRVKLAGRELNRSTFRHYISRIILTFIGFGRPNMPYDSQSGLKFLRNSKDLKIALQSSFKTRWFFDIELMSRLGMQKANFIWEEPVQSWADVKGSKIRLVAIPLIIKEIFVARRALNQLWSKS